MVNIPEGTKFLGVASSYDTLERRSTQVNNQTQYYTLEDFNASGYVKQDDNSPNAVLSVWAGSQAQYDALGTYNPATLYFIV